MKQENEIGKAIFFGAMAFVGSKLAEIIADKIKEKQEREINDFI